MSQPSSPLLTTDQLVELIGRTRQTADHPIVVGVSGHAGSGKSTLARALVDRMPEAVRLRGDDFLDPTRSHQRSTDWDGVERSRLADEVLRPFRGRQPGQFRRYDWGLRRLGEPEPVPVAEVLVVDLIGLFHPEVTDLLDLKVWCEVDPATATARGISRDRELGRDHSRLWHQVWVPNEQEFAARFDPRGQADLRIVPEPPTE